MAHVEMESRDRKTEQIIRLLQQVGRSAAQFAPDQWMELNLTIGQLKSLFFIEFQGSTNSKSLASALGVTPPNITGIIDRLVEHGLVSREENPENRRMLILKATDKGKKLVSKLRESRAGRLGHMLSKLSTEELSALASGLLALARVAQAEQAPSQTETRNTE